MAGRPKMMVNKITEMEAEAEEEFVQDGYMISILH